MIKNMIKSLCQGSVFHQYFTVYYIRSVMNGLPGISNLISCFQTAVNNLFSIN